MTPSRCTSVAFGFILLGLISFLASGIAAWRSAGLAAGFVGTWRGARLELCLRSCRSSCPSLARAAQRLVMVEL